MWISFPPIEFLFIVIVMVCGMTSCRSCKYLFPIPLSCFKIYSIKFTVGNFIGTVVKTKEQTVNYILDEINPQRSKVQEQLVDGDRK